MATYQPIYGFMCTFHQANKIFLHHIQSQISQPLSNEVSTYLLHKIHHSFGVLSACQKIIALDHKLSITKEKTREEFEVAAFLHDIGRFYQHDTKKIFSSKDYLHGAKGSDILRAEGIKNPHILLAIKYHEFLDLSGLETELDYMMADASEKEKITRICSLVRDADKLQNLEYLLHNHASYLSLEKNTNTVREPKNISDTCIELLRKKTCFPRGIAETAAEKLLYYYSWIFDIHHEGTKTALKQMKFKDRYADILEKFGVRKEIVDTVRG